MLSGDADLKVRMRDFMPVDISRLADLIQRGTVHEWISRYHRDKKFRKKVNETIKRGENYVCMDENGDIFEARARTSSLNPKKFEIASFSLMTFDGIPWFVHVPRSKIKLTAGSFLGLFR
jgi:hypothetical protein